jgi:hypothetical protein
MLLLLLPPLVAAQDEGCNLLWAGMPVQLPGQRCILPRPVRRTGPAATPQKHLKTCEEKDVSSLLGEA